MGEAEMSGFGKSPESNELSDELGSSIKTHNVPASQLAMEKYINDILVSNDYDEVSTQIVGNLEYVFFRKAGVTEKTLLISYDGAKYRIKDGTSTVLFLAKENGELLLQENGDELLVV